LGSYFFSKKGEIIMGLFKAVTKAGGTIMRGSTIPWRTMRAYRSLSKSEIGILLDPGSDAKILRMPPEVARGIAIELLAFYLRNKREGK
jgi:hypothetical protein